MTKINKISNIDPQRLETLENRYDRLLEANQKHNYIYSDKINRYIDCLYTIKAQIAKRREENRKANENQPWRKALLATKGMNGAQAMISLSKTDLFNLTAPDQCLQ